LCLLFTLSSHYLIFTKRVDLVTKWVRPDSRADCGQNTFRHLDPHLPVTHVTSFRHQLAYFDYLAVSGWCPDLRSPFRGPLYDQNDFIIKMASVNMTIAYDYWYDFEFHMIIELHMPLTITIIYNTRAINHYLFYWSQLWKLCLLFTLSS